MASGAEILDRGVAKEIQRLTYVEVCIILIRSNSLRISHRRVIDSQTTVFIDQRNLGLQIDGAQTFYRHAALGRRDRRDRVIIPIRFTYGNYREINSADSVKVEIQLGRRFERERRVDPGNDGTLIRYPRFIIAHVVRAESFDRVDRVEVRIRGKIFAHSIREPHLSIITVCHKGAANVLQPFRLFRIIEHGVAIIFNAVP